MTSAISKLKKKKKTKTADTSDDNSRKEARTTTTKKDSPETKLVKIDPAPRLVRTTALPDRTDVAKRTVANLKDRQDDASSSSSSSSDAKRKAVQIVETKPVKSTQTSPAPPDAKSKRDALVSDSSVLRAVNAVLDDQDLARVYDKYYDENGNRKKLGATRDDLYTMLVDDDPAYVRTPVTDVEFAEFTRANPVIEAQSMWPEEQEAYGKALDEYTDELAAYVAARSAFKEDFATYKAARDEWYAAPDDDKPEMPVTPEPPMQPEEPAPPPKTVEEAVERGDYFHVHNTSKLRPKKQDTTARARRIVVNVTTQEAGLKASAGISRLFTDRDVSPYLDHYKIYLSQDPDDGGVKRDKLVIYYEVPPGATNDLDPVGDRIATVVDQSVDGNEVSEDFAPFYSRIGRGIAWAEEPAAYVNDLNDSFTGTRSTIMQSVLDNNATVVSPDAFIALVRTALASSNVNPQDPHRHLPGKEPAAYISRRQSGPEPKPTPAKPPVPARKAPLSNVPLSRSAQRQARIEARRVATIPVTKITAKVPAKPLPPVPVQRIQTTTGPSPLKTGNRW
ncbi:MAG TPA: T3SS effector HopA1 family protein [Actinophytocola sp.]|jgi:hypothetical protein|nr:T3SS effector HopA1 family protein [Actinophytocola sp.]